MLNPQPWSSGNVKQDITVREKNKKLNVRVSPRIAVCLNNLGLMILGNEFYVAVLKHCLVDFSLI